MLPQSFTHYYGILSSHHYGMALIFATKCVIGFPFMFHFANGLRHLNWDMGRGLQISSVYATGWTVLGVSALLTLIAAAM